MDDTKGLKSEKEWFKQSDYDLKTAESLFKSKKYIYTIFMCHLCIEKALKGVYVKKLKTNPPKIHDLVYLIKKIDIELPDNYLRLIESLNELCVPIRYPEDLNILIRHFKKAKTEKILANVKVLLKWLKEIS